MVLDLLTAALVLVGGAFMLLASVGIVRLPDLFTRMQAATKGATLGSGCLLLAVAAHFWRTDVAARAMLVVLFILMTSPVAAHLIARAAYAVGVPFWEGTLRDELGEARKRENKERAAEPSKDPPPDGQIAPS